MVWTELSSLLLCTYFRPTFRGVLIAKGVLVTFTGSTDLHPCFQRVLASAGVGVSPTVGGYLRTGFW
jgi:hypothetical protein